MRVPKILQTINTLYIKFLTSFYITQTRIGIIFIVFSSLFAFFLQKDRDTLIEQPLTLIDSQEMLKYSNKTVSSQA